MLTGHKVSQPIFTSVSLLLRESELDELLLFVTHDLETLHVCVEVLEVNLSIRNVAGTQSLVVLVVPSFLVLVLLFPLLVFGHGEEASHVAWVLGVALPNFDDRSDELQEKARNLEQAGELTLEEVDE